MRELTYYVGQSLDGFIAGPAGQADFYLFEGDHQQAINESYPETVPTAWRDAAGISGPPKQFDTVLMGRGTYEAGVATGAPSPYSHLRQFVVSRSMTASPHEDVELISGDALARVRELKAEDGLGIWLCGGGGLAEELLPEIDQIVVKIHPVIARAGVPLFTGEFAPARFHLADSRVFGSGVALMTYRTF
ncbi:dihydrofolate reductase family protein [Amycolatopsis magusensis]|uniref:Dihydrofolate reductase n=1 Tax=Amycolatopsis magusensis TaxID=882444 RepID=A0ABS4PPW3_9PSEU|nr:dihydrofolate reductase family protein [Amycolatopsis magusensis]MBP2181467.1 dihydrofolate reductase [Amycolatopsis magusensis]